MLLALARKKTGLFARHLLTLSAGTALAQLIPVLVSPLLTRLYAPEAMGEVGIFMSTVSILCVLQTGRLELGLVAETLHSRARALLLTTVLLLLPLTTILWLLAGILAQSSLAPLVVKGFWPWLLPAMLVVALTALAQNWFNRLKLRREMAFAQVLRAAFNAVISLGAGIAGLSQGMVAGYVVSYVLSFTLVYRRALKGLGNQAKMPLGRVLDPVKRHYRLPLYQAPHSLLNTLYLAMPVYLLTAWVSLEFSGFYSVAYRMVIAPTVILSAVLQTLLYARASEKVNRSEAISRDIRGFLKWATPAFALIYGVLMLAAPPLFGVVFGEGWETSGDIARLLAPWVFMRAITGPLSFITILANKQKVALGIEIFYSALTILALWVGVQEGHLHAITYLSLAGTFVVAGQLGWYLSLATRIDRGVAGGRG